MFTLTYTLLSLAPALLALLSLVAVAMLTARMTRALEAPMHATMGADGTDTWVIDLEWELMALPDAPRTARQARPNTWVKAPRIVALAAALVLLTPVIHASATFMPERASSSPHARGVPPTRTHLARGVGGCRAPPHPGLPQAST